MLKIIQKKATRVVRPCTIKQRKTTSRVYDARSPGHNRRERLRKSWQNIVETIGWREEHPVGKDQAASTKQERVEDKILL